MPTLTKLGRDLSKSARRRDRKITKDSKEIWDGLSAAITGRLVLMVDKLFPYGKNYSMDDSVWNGNQRKFLNGMESDIRTAYDKLAAMAVKNQRRAFFSVYDDSLKYFKSILPTKVVVKAKKMTKLKFGDPSLKFDLLTDRVKREVEAIVALGESKGELPDRVFTKDYSDMVYKIKQKAGFKCSKCGKKFGAAKLDVHHKDGNRKNNAPSNLRVLCHSCHGKLSQKKQMRMRGLTNEMVYALTEFLPMREVEDETSLDFDFIWSSRRDSGGDDRKNSRMVNQLFEVPSPVELRVGSGKTSGDWLKFMRGQLDQDLLPQNKIKTLSSDHTKFVQGVMLGGVAKGKDLGWQKDKVMSYLGKGLTNKEELRKLEYNTMRIMRTSHQRAGNAASAYFAQRNSHIIKCLVRSAGPRACLACICLDGTEIPIGDSLQDHPNGQCVASYRIKSLEEMGYSLSDLPPAAKRRWTPIRRPYKDMRSKFHALGDKDQKKVFGNNKLFNLWKTEKFPLEAMVVNRGGMFVPATYKQIAAKLPQMGGISSPKASLMTQSGLQPEFTDKAFLNVMDAKDRANGRLSAIRDVDADDLSGLAMKSKYKQNLFGMGDDALDAVPQSVLEDAVARLNGVSPVKAPWWDFNEYARTLGLATRKATDGKMYWAVGKGKVDDVVKGIVPKKVVKTVAQMEKEAKVWADRCSGGEKAAFHDWGESHYKPVRAFQIRDEVTIVSKDGLKDIISKVDSALKDAPKWEGVSWRGIKDVSPEVFNSFQKGDVLDFKAFTSTSSSKKIGQLFSKMDAKGVAEKNGLLFEIRGKSGVFIRDLSTRKEEMEVLFSQGSKFRVLSREVTQEQIISDFGVPLWKVPYSKIVLEEI